MIVMMKQAFLGFPVVAGWGAAWPFGSPGCGRPGLATTGCVLEALNLCLNEFDVHYADRDLRRFGQHIVVVTAGSSVFEVDARLLRLTKQRVLDGAIGVDVVCLNRPPLHAVPLFVVRGSRGVPDHVRYNIPRWLHVAFSWASTAALPAELRIASAAAPEELNPFVNWGAPPASAGLPPAADARNRGAGRGSGGGSGAAVPEARFLPFAQSVLFGPGDGRTWPLPATPLPRIDVSRSTMDARPTANRRRWSHLVPHYRAGAADLPAGDTGFAAVGEAAADAASGMSTLAADVPDVDPEDVDAYVARMRVCISRMGAPCSYAFPVWAPHAHMHFPHGRPFDICISRMGTPCSCARPNARCAMCVSRMVSTNACAGTR